MLLFLSKASPNPNPNPNPNQVAKYTSGYKKQLVNAHLASLPADAYA